MCDLGNEALMHSMRWWQIRAAHRGYYRRQRPVFEAARLQGFITAKSFGAKDINSPEELLPLPWDVKHEVPDISDEEIEALRQQLINENKR